MQARQKDPELDLRWLRPRPVRGIQDRIAEYVAHMTPGGITPSNFMAMCEAAAEDGVKSVKCRSCKGMGFRKGDSHKIAVWQKELAKRGITPERAAALREKLRDESQCRKCGGSGFRQSTAKREEFDDMFTTVRCERCRGCGEVLNEDLEDACPRCLGDACVVPATVKRSGSSRKGRLPPGATSMTDSDGNPSPGGVWTSDEHGQHEPDEAGMDEFRRMSSVMESLPPELRAAVEAFEGSDGHKWAPTKWGRTFALWPLTQAGKCLFEDAAKRSTRRSGYLRRPMDVLTEEREAESRAEVPNMRRRALIADAQRQAMLLEARMRDQLETLEAAL